MNSDLRFAIIGCGRIAQRHALKIQNVGRLVAVCDIIPERAEKLAKAYNAKSYDNVDTLLLENKGVDVVSICTPNGLHAEHTLKALNAGHHVLCEKPMAIKVSDCIEMISTSERTGRRLFIVKQNRFNPPVIAVKKLLDEGRLGKIYSTQLNCFWNRDADYYKNSWKGSIDLDGGTLFTQFSHFIDLLYWLIGDIRNVTAVLGNFAHRGIIEFEDTGIVTLEFANGSIGALNYTVNSHERNMEGSLTIFGEKGTVKIGGQYLNELEYQSIDGYRIENLEPGNKANHYGNYEGSMSNHDKVYENLVDVLKNNAAITTSATDGLKSVEIIERIYSSAKNASPQ